MKVLLVGAGAVGQVYGQSLARAGCEVSYLLKDKYVEKARHGFPLHRLKLLGRPKAPFIFRKFRVLTSVERVAQENWDQIWLCVSSTALRSGNWVNQLAQATGDATIVMLQPALEDQAWMLGQVREDRLVTGMIGIISYSAPLNSNEKISIPGTAYFCPPGSPTLLSGADQRARLAAEALSRGGVPARWVKDARNASAVPSAILTAFLCELETQGWSLERTLTTGSLKRICSAAFETTEIAVRSLGLNRPFWISFVLKPLILRLALLWARATLPFDLEDLLRVHFTKVKDQTRLMVQMYIESGEKLRLPTASLKSLCR